MKFGFTFGKGMTLVTFGLGCLLSFLVETPNRHTQLLGYIAPNAINIFINLLEQHRLFKRKSWHTYLVTMFAWAVIAGHFVRQSCLK